MKIVYIDRSMSAFRSPTRFRGTCSAKVMTKLTQVYPDAEIVYRDLAARIRFRLFSGRLKAKTETRRPSLV